MGILLGLLFLTPLRLAQAQSYSVFPTSAPILITYPEEGATLTISTATFLLGRIFPPTASLQINGQPIKTHRNGGFIAYLPVPVSSPLSPFLFHCELQTKTTTYILDHKVRIISSQPISSDETAIDPNSISPASSMELRVGDWLDVQIKGTPDAAGEFSISGVKKHIPLTSLEGSPGLYRGSYQIQPGDKANEA
ncbi:MAG: hypothetical protein HY400_07320, partial [Elusimicrobia bacterium]|nr:hypothetical protein [Elusimicrobiota bacterium]